MSDHEINHWDHLGSSEMGRGGGLSALDRACREPAPEPPPVVGEAPRAGSGGAGFVDRWLLPGLLVLAWVVLVVGVVRMGGGQ